MYTHANGIKLKLITQWPGYRALAWHKDCLYASKGYKLFRLEFSKCEENEKGRVGGYDISRELVGLFSPDFLRGIASRNRMTSRLLRTGFQGVSCLKDGRLIAIVAKNLAVLDSGEIRFRTTWRVKRGNRPRGMAVTPEGYVFWGEYFRNPGRDAVHVYGSYDRGDTWEIVYTFPSGSINHIHNILYDPWEDCLWMITGDEDSEPKIMRATKDWAKVDTIREGTQQDRAATMIIEENDIYYATDTPHEQNRIYCMNKTNGHAEAVAITSGPAMWSSKANGAMFFSTAAEPGASYYPAACVWGSANGNSWVSFWSGQRIVGIQGIFSSGMWSYPQVPQKKKSSP